jgi:eukaryotic-like serine/threonine-protein kinase
MQYRHGETIPGTQYRFIREIGAGGHGTVYAVEHTFLEAPAVMKLLHAELVDRGDLTQRMTREAKTLAKLRHPNIVEVRDGGISGEGQPRPYFVMESLDGMPLRELLRHAPGGVGIMPALRIMTGVLEGLEHAHRGGVIHRDIKPDNIFLHRTSTDLTVPKILDFGIAHLLMAQRTTGRYFLGTPRYAAPEQLRGDAPTPRTDIYAAGLVLYEMLTGLAPFAEHREVGAVLKANLEEPLPSVMSACPDAPLYLANFVAMLTAKDPGERPPTAFAAAVGLREIRSRLENQQAGVLNNTGFKTEPTPMENMLHAAARPDDSGLAATREEPLVLPSGEKSAIAAVRAAVSGMSAPVAPVAASGPGPAVSDTVVDATRAHPVGSARGPMLNPTIPHTPRVPGLAPPIDNSVAMADTQIGAVKNVVDRNAKTNTAAPIVQRSRPNYDTEMLLRGLSFDPAAYAETEQAQPRSDDRTPGALAVSRNPSFVTPTPPPASPAAGESGLSPFARQVMAFCLTLFVIGLIGAPILWKVRKEYGTPADAPPAAAAPIAAPAPPPSPASAAPASAAPAPTTAVTTPPSASVAAAPEVSATAPPTAKTTPTPPAKPRAPARPKIDPNDPSTIPME